MNPTLFNIYQMILNESFSFEVKDERDWSAQPTGQQYYVGRPKPGSNIDFNIQWKPREGRLSWWMIRDAARRGSFVLQTRGRFPKRLLTKEIETQLVSATAVS